MAVVEKVVIDGFWGDRHLELDLFEDVNFLIGPNGSGKTTAINIIAAALSGDFGTLDRLPFKSIEITLFDASTRKKPSVQVIKKGKRRSPYPSIDYIIKDSARGEANHYSLDEYAEERFFRDAAHHSVSQRRLYRHVSADVVHRLRDLAPTSWLSIHRAAGPRNAREERGYEYTVDQKLDEICDSLVRFFAELEKRSTEEVSIFQQSIFLSLIYEPKQDELFQDLRRLDLAKEQGALIEIFEKFKLPKERYLKRSEDHYKRLNKAVVRNDGIFKYAELSLLMNGWRIHSIIQDWNSLIKRQAEIFSPRDSFLSIINVLLQRKEIRINDRNELFAVTQSGKELSPNELSSGEKQLLIILGEALLQKSSDWIYIADEPELSLHVNWQEVLVDNLRQMNPSGQIIIATHSPDIVSHFSNRIHDMEKILP